MTDTDILPLIGHPERLNGDTLYALRTAVARYPYFQTARLLLLRNLYLLHEPDFGRELRKSVFYIADRRALWMFVHDVAQTTPAADDLSVEPTFDRTASLIDAFLGTMPEQATSLVIETPASTDYMATLAAESLRPSSSQTEETPAAGVPAGDLAANTPKASVPDAQAPLQKEAPQATDPISQPSIPEDDAPLASEFLTETLARIYIKQKKYDRALEIIRSLYLNYPEKSIYFADQIRFLEKLIRNNNSKKIN